MDKEAPKWHIDDIVNWRPNESILMQPDFEKWAMKGLTPKEPFIDKKTPITTFGSCFATEISKHLSASGYNLLGVPDGLGQQHATYYDNVVAFIDTINNTFAIKQLFDWAVWDRNFYEETWHRGDKSIIEKNEKLRAGTKELFKNTEVFIITLGISEVWYNKETNDVFWRAIPKNMFKSKVHGFKIATFSENKENIKSIYKTIKHINPNAKVVFTISPVPIQATFRPIPAIVADNVSKALLRCSLDEFLRENEDFNKTLFYFPGYEFIKDVFPVRTGKSSYREDNRHVKSYLVEKIIKIFETYYSKTED